jgi:hypothetical protein
MESKTSNKPSILLIYTEKRPNPEGWKWQIALARVSMILPRPGVTLAAERHICGG